MFKDNAPRMRKAPLHPYLFNRYWFEYGKIAPNMVDPVMTTPFARGLHVEKYNDICKMAVMADKPKPNPVTYVHKFQTLS